MPHTVSCSAIRATSLTFRTSSDRPCHTHPHQHTVTFLVENPGISRNTQVIVRPHPIIKSAWLITIELSKHSWMDHYYIKALDSFNQFWVQLSATVIKTTIPIATHLFVNLRMNPPDNSQFVISKTAFEFFGWIVQWFLSIYIRVFQHFTEKHSPHNQWPNESCYCTSFLRIIDVSYINCS